MARIRRPTRSLLAGVLCLLTVPAAADPAALLVELSQKRLPSGRTGKVYVKVAVTGAPDRGDARAPVNAAIVLDRSGSMAGEKLEQAKQAAIAALERLSPDDIVAVVAYDTTVRVLVPATRATDKREIVRAIRGLTAGNTTALYAGVSRGAHEVRKFLADERVNRVILLSDGLANVGPSSPELLAQLGASLAKDGISVSTVGLGLDYNEDLMTRLARASDGNHAFVEHPSALASIFDHEFGELLSIVAKEVEVRIECPRGVRPVRVLGRDAEIAGQTVFVRLGQVGSRQERYVLLEAEVSPRAAGPEFDVASVSVSLSGVRGGPARVSLSGRARLAFTDSSVEAERSVHQGIMVAVVEQVANEATKRALDLRDRGLVGEANELLLSNALYLGDNAARLGSDKLRRQGERSREAASSLDEKQWVKKRKEMREEQHQLDTQQSYGKEEDPDHP
jgi:Ca-activated chloride channel family protein